MSPGASSDGILIQDVTPSQMIKAKIQFTELQMLFYVDHR